MRLAPRNLFYSFDQRYAEDWLSKFQLSGPMALALGMLMAIIYLLVRPDPLHKEVLLPIGLLLSGIGLFYPLLFPPAVCIIGVRALVTPRGFADSQLASLILYRGMARTCRAGF